MKEKNNIEIPVLTSHLNVENPNENVDSINADLHRNLSFYPKEIGIGKVNIGSLDVEGFILPNGDFVKTSELLNALENSLKQKESTQYYIRGIVKSKVDMETIINNIKAKIANMSKIVLNGDNVSTSISIRHPDLGEFDTERTFEHYVYTHHGETKQFTVPCGEYVSVEEVKKALQKYFYYDVKEKSPKTELDLNSTPIHEHDEEEFESKRKNKINNPKQERLKKIRIPKKKPDKKDDEYDEDVIEEEKREDIKENDEKIVITRIQRNLIPALATATAVIELFSFLSITPPTAEQVANYTINHQGTSYVYETDSQARNRLIGSLELGETIDLKDGLTYYESSDYDMGGKTQSGYIGNEYRKAGPYTIDRLNIIINGENNVFDIYDRENAGATINDCILMSAAANGKVVDNMIIRCHIGGPVCGWVDASALFPNDEFEKRVIATKTVLDNTYSGSEVLKGDFINVQTENGPVSIRIRDENGNLVNQGKIVKGSDGQEYQINSLSVETNQNGKQKINFDVQNFAKALAATAAAGVLADILIKQRRKKEQEKDAEDLVERKKENKEEIELETEKPAREHFPKNLGWDIIKEGKHRGEHLETTRSKHDAVERARKRYEREVSFFARTKDKMKGKKPDWWVIEKALAKDDITIEDVDKMFTRSEYDAQGRSI